MRKVTHFVSNKIRNVKVKKIVSYFGDFFAIQIIPICHWSTNCGNFAREREREREKIILFKCSVVIFGLYKRYIKKLPYTLYKV